MNVWIVIEDIPGEMPEIVGVFSSEADALHAFPPRRYRSHNGPHRVVTNVTEHSFQGVINHPSDPPEWDD